MNMVQRTRYAVTKAALGLAAAAMLFSFSTAHAQAAGAKVHGAVNDPAGALVTKGEVRLTTDKTGDVKDFKWVYTAPLDAKGQFTFSDVKAGDYTAFVFQGTVAADYQPVSVKDGDDKTLNFDMTREEYMKTLTPERRKEIEDYKAKNAAVTQGNKVVSNLNATLAKVRADIAAASKDKGDVSQDVADMKTAAAAKPDESILQIELGNAEQAQADHLIKADKAAGKLASSDDDVKQLLTDASTAYQKSIDLNAASKKPDVHLQASAANQMGNALAKAGKLDDSVAAFEKAATLDAPGAGMYYNNEAAVMFNAGQGDKSLAAAEKAIAADPKRPDPYFIKGQALLSKATDVDPKTGMIKALPGTVEAYEKYLELAPDGPQAETVQQILQGLGQKVQTKYKAGKK
jgi:tetratricopeptide (TPR) repeat protein